MSLEGLHHITAITGDAPRNVGFYAGVLGLRLVKKTVNFDQPDVYHLYFGDETGAPGSILTFFEFPGAAPGRPGDGMVHTIQWRVASEDAIAFWHHRLEGAGVATERDVRFLRFSDPEGLAHELVVAGADDPPLVALAHDVPAEHALQGFHGVRAYAAQPARSARLLEHLGFTPGETDGTWVLRGAGRHAELRYEPSPRAGVPSAGTVHHVAWSAADDAELESFRQKARDGGARPTPLIDRQYFHSVYFREPSGVLFELASRDIGFDVDEPVHALGSELKLPPQYEGRRAELLGLLTPLPDPRSEASA
jgi:glyoxalase family protein